MTISFGSEQFSHAALFNAATCLFSDVTNALAKASPGDVIQLPAGTNAWTQTLTLNGISLLGAGTNSTMIIDEESRAAGGQIINLYPVAGQLAEISNIQFCGGVTNTSINYFGSIAVFGSVGSSWRIDHNVFNGLYAKNICTYGNSLSVIDHNAFYEKGISIEDNSYLPDDGEGDGSYAAPATYGLNSSNVLYIEDNYFTNLEGYVASVGACDGEGGARMVFRNNIVWNDCFNNHGTETGGRNRSERSFEIYNNTFIFTSASPSYPCYAVMMIRGGAGVIFSNTCTGYNALVALRNYRSTTAFCGQWQPFCGANGIDVWDSNSPTLYLSGTSSGPNGADYLQVNGAHWTTNQWYGYTLLNTNNSAFSVVTSNTTNTMYYIGSDQASASIIPYGVMTFNTGDHFQLHLVYAALDQPGRGSGDLLKDNGQDSNGNLITINTVTGVASWPREAFDGIYCWGNTVNSSATGLISPYPTLVAGRDFYNNTTMPGYTPFVYPHPLDINTANTNTNNGNGGGNTNTLLPPSNLHFKGNGL